MAALDAILFDLGGTLDGRGGWRARFHRLFTDAGVSCAFEGRVAAFDYAEARARRTADMAHAGLREMVTRHVGWQLESLGVEDGALARAVVDRFVDGVERAAAGSRAVLRELAAKGFALAVVSNGCGNVARLCQEYGFAPMLAAIVDSHRIGASKPDPAIFRHALQALQRSPAQAAFVGDSPDRDIEPAKALGMRTVWLSAPHQERPHAADFVLDRLADLPAALGHAAVRTA